MRKTISLLIATVLVLACISTAFAGINAISWSRSLNFSGTTAVCKASVSETGSECSISAELYQGSTLVAYWDDLAMNKASVSGNAYNCVSGLTYRLEITATVNGNSVPVSSVTKTCP